MTDKAAFNINYNNLVELKSLQRPPSLVLEVIQLVLLLMDSPNAENTEWKTMMNEICNKETLHKMQNLDISKIPPGNVDKAKAMAQSMVANRVKRVSSTAGSLYLWATAVLDRC